MLNIYSPSNIYPKTPVACCCIPSKIYIGIVQFVFFLSLLTLTIVAEKYNYGYAVLAVLSFAFFLGFILEWLKMMLFYFVLAIINGTLVVVFIVLNVAGSKGSVVFYLDGIVRNTSTELFFIVNKYMNGPVFLLLVAILLSCVYIHYLSVIWSAIKHVAVNQKLANIEPEFDTTQGIYQYNEDAYDGTEEPANKLYPLL